jgi:ABC-type lipoprotein release transport system permease subunit
MPKFTASLIALYVVCAGGILAGLWWPEMGFLAPWLVAGKFGVLVLGALAAVLSTRRRWIPWAAAGLAVAGLAVPWPLATGIAAGGLLGLALLWQAALSRKGAWVTASGLYFLAALSLLLPRLDPGARFNVMMVLFIVVFITFAAAVAALFTWLFLKVFEALDRNFGRSFLTLLPLLAAPGYLLSRVILPTLSGGDDWRLFAALGLATDLVLLAGVVLLLLARLLGQRLGPRHFVPLVAWKLLRSQRVVPTARSRRLQRLRELVPQGSGASYPTVLAELVTVAVLAIGLFQGAALLVASGTWLAFWRGVAGILAAAWLTSRSLSCLGRPRLLYIGGATGAAGLALYAVARGQMAGETFLPFYLASALAALPLLLLAAQSTLRGVLALRQKRSTLPRSLDPRLAPVIETRIREGVGASVFVSVVGVAIGVWALIVVLSVMGGFSGEMQERIVRTKDHLMVKATDRDRGIVEPLKLARDLAQVDGVASASVYLEAEGMMSSSTNISATVTVRGLDRTPSALAFLESSLVGGSTYLFAHPEELVSYPELSPAPYLQEGGDGFFSADAPPPLLEPHAPLLGEGDTPLFPDLILPAEGDPPPPDDLPELADAPGLIAMPAIGDAPTPPSTSLSPYLSGSGQHVLPPVVIGQELARSLGAGVGSRITVISPDGDIGPMGVQPKARAFRVAAIFSTGMYEYDLKLAYMYLPDARRFFNLGEAIDHIDVRLHDLHAAAQVRGHLEPLLAHQDVEVLTWQEMNRNLFSALKLERVVMFIVLGFIILIASFNIVSSLIIIIRKRLSAIAILRTLGASSGEVTRVFFLLGGAAGLFGIASGVMMGLSSCGIIEHLGLTLPREYYIRSLPVAVDGWQVLQIAAAALTMTALAARYPGRLAARVLLVEGLKDER